MNITGRVYRGTTEACITSHPLFLPSPINDTHCQLFSSALPLQSKEWSLHLEYMQCLMGLIKQVYEGKMMRNYKPSWETPLETFSETLLEIHLNEA